MRILHAMAMTGRNALTDESLALILELAEKGATNYVIAAAVGVHPDTFQTWTKKGRDELAQYGEYVPEDADLSLFAQLHVQIEYVRAKLAADLSAVVISTAKSGAPNTWQAAMTFLERRYPADWGKRETRVHEGDVPNGLPQINVLVLNDPNARSAHRDLLRSVDAANRARTGVPVGPGVGRELEAGSTDGRDVIDVDTR